MVVVAQLVLLGGFYERIAVGTLTQGTVAHRNRVAWRHSATCVHTSHFLTVDTPTGRDEIEVDAETFDRYPNGARVKWATVAGKPRLGAPIERLGPSSFEMLLSVLLGLATLVLAGAPKFAPLPWYWQRTVRLPRHA